MKKLFVILISLAILLPSSAIGTELSQWKKGDRNMIDLVKSGYNIVGHSHAYDPNRPDRSVDIFILQKHDMVYRCTDLYNWKTTTRILRCKKLVSPQKMAK